MNIREVTGDKKTYIDLLLIADEQEDMIDLYLSRGMMFVLEDNGVKAECVVTDEGGGVIEIKNIAVMPDSQRRGYGKALIDFVADTYKGRFTSLKVGTGDVPWILRFYEKCGLRRCGVIENFFVDNYDHPMFDSGVQLVDMVYLSRNL